MITSNFHTHTFRCNHALGSEREYVESAIKANIKNLGFSDHSPYFFSGEYYSGYRMKREQFEDYVKSVNSLKKEYEKDINIYLGIEAEYYPKYFGKLLDFINPYNIDYLLLGQHFINNEEDGKYAYNFNDDENSLNTYVNQVIEGLETKKFSYLAHPDIPLFTTDDEIYNKYMSKLCEYAKINDVPLEFNLLGFATNRHYPSLKFFEIASKYQCKVIYGIDAHNKEAILNVQETVKKADEILDRLNLKRTEKIKLLNGKIV